MSDTSWRIAALNGIRRALGGTAQQFDIEKIPLEQLQRTKLGLISQLAQARMSRLRADITEMRGSFSAASL